METLLERGPLIEACTGALARAAGGRGGFVILEGSAGIGKSSVLRAARAGAPVGIDVLTGIGSEVAREFSYGVVLDLFGPAVRAAEADGRTLFEGAARIAGTVLEPGAEGPAGDELALLHSLYWLTARLTERRPVALVVDDAQWADRASLRFLLYLAERIEDLPLAVVLAVRTGEPDTPADLLRSIAERAGAPRHRLEPLSRAAVAALVRERTPGATESFCATVHAMTAGNPFLVRELLSAATASGIEATDEGAGLLEGFAPERVLDAVLVRLRRLPDSAEAVARTAAVLGPGARLAEVAELAGLDADATAEAVDSLVRAEILEPGDPIAFAHPLLRTAVHADIPAAGRARLHARAARMLAETGAPAAAIGGQLLAAGPAGDSWVVDRLVEAAGEATARGAADPAVAFLRRALDEPPANGARLPVLLQLAEAEAAAGRPEAPGRLEQALALSTSDAEAARILGSLGWMLHKAGRLEESAVAFEQAMERLGDADPAARDGLMLGFIGAAWQVRDRAPEAVAEWSALLERADAAEAPEPTLTAELATLRLFRGDPHDDVVRYARHALGGGRLIDEQGADSLPIWHAVACLSWSDELDDAEATIAAAIADAERRGLIVSLAQCYYARAWPRYWRGQVDDAVSDAAAAAEVWRGGWGYYLPVALYWLAIGHLERGDLDAATAALELPGGRAAWEGTTMFTLWLSGEAEVSWARGDAETALEQFLGAGKAAVEEYGVVNPAVVAWRSGAARAAAALGRHDQAEQLVAEELDLARRFGAARPLGVALRAAGVVARGEGGLELVEEAVQVLEDSPSRLELVRALVDQGALLRSLGRRTDARVPLRRALDLVRTCPGAVVVRERAREELIAAGGRPRREALSGSDALTPTERRIAALAAAGLGNRAIAEQLFVSSKTVEWHLGSVFRKLGISSRQDLAEALRT